MATVGAALRFRDCCEEADEQQHFAGLKSLAPKLLTICVIFCAMSFAGCARNPAQREASPTLTLHEGMPVVKGVKYVITKWFREGTWLLNS